MATLASLSMGKTTFKQFIKWELSDAIVTEVTNTAKLAGFSQEQSANLGYYITKAAYQGAKGELKGIVNILGALNDAALTQTEAINKLNGIGVDVNAPKDKNEATDRVINKIYNKD